MHMALRDLYEDYTIEAAKEVKIDDEIWQKAIEAVYGCGEWRDELIESEDVRALIQATYDRLMEGVNKGISVRVTDEFKSYLSRNVFIFSGCKTATELQEVSGMLRDEGGAIKPFGQFIGDVRQVHEDYNDLYLQAEYRFAQQSANSASKWQRWKERGVKMLQYRTAADDHVRPEHAILDGITRPFDDKFWDTNMPPNGWRCRCVVVPVDPLDATETPSDVADAASESINTKPKERIFRFNPGKEGVIYPPKHPYYKQSEAVKTSVERLADNMTDNEQ